MGRNQWAASKRLPGAALSPLADDSAQMMFSPQLSYAPASASEAERGVLDHVFLTAHHAAPT